LTGSSIRFQNGQGVCSQAPISLIYKSAADTCLFYRFAWELIFFCTFVISMKPRVVLPVQALLVVGLLSAGLHAQSVGIGTANPDPSARLHISDNARGLLIPNVALTATDVAAPVTSPATSLLVYNTNNTAGTGATAVTPGFYYWDGSQWVRLADGGKAWLLTGNAGTNPAVNFLGTTDAQPLCIRVDNQETFRFNPPGASAPAWSIQRGGGDPRGLHAVDLQSARAAATQVASGDYSVIGGGQDNTASGYAATVGGGLGNTASDDAATVGGGATNTASGDVATVGGGKLNTAGGYAATVGGGVENTAGGFYATVGGGVLNTARGDAATIGGGRSNIASGDAAIVGGGEGNTASAEDAIVGGGKLNTAGGYAATVGGGYRNTASKNYTTVSGGYENTASDWGATVGGGQANTASDGDATVGGGRLNTAGGYAATIGGGQVNTAGGFYATVGGGYENTASGYAATVGGGRSNTAGDFYATVGGGYENTASSKGATVGGGYQNTASFAYATVGGGRSNTASGKDATIGGGYRNTASGSLATVGGGLSNTARGDYATVGGGRSNTASGEDATIGGGMDNTASGYRAIVGGGWHNAASGNYSVVLGGYGNTADADFNLVFGQEVNPSAIETHRVYFFGPGAPRPSGFLVINRLDGDHPIHVGTSGTNGNGAHLTGGGKWTDGSSRSFKERFVQYRPAEVLEKILQLPVEGYFYKGTQEYHITPMAEDFYRLFGTGVHEIIETDSTGQLVRRPNPDVDKYLAASDVAGVALLGVQALHEENAQLRQRVFDMRAENAQLRQQVSDMRMEDAQLRQRVSDLERENAALRARLERLETLMQRIASTQTNP